MSGPTANAAIHWLVREVNVKKSVARVRRNVRRDTAPAGRRQHDSLWQALVGWSAVSGMSEFTTPLEVAQLKREVADLRADIKLIFRGLERLGWTVSIDGEVYRG